MSRPTPNIYTSLKRQPGITSARRRGLRRAIRLLWWLLHPVRPKRRAPEARLVLSDRKRDNKWYRLPNTTVVGVFHYQKKRPIR
jgi:hypothetical protein